MTRRAKTSTCRLRPDGAMVHRTFPIRDRDGRWLGSTCRCGAAVTTPGGGPSHPQRLVGQFARVVDTKAHRARIASARLARKRARKLIRRNVT